MHRHLLICSVVWFAVFAVAQQKSASKAAPTATPATAAVLPSEEVVNAFLQQTLGYDPAISWKITGIKPAAAEGLAEVDVSMSNAQGSQVQKFYVTPDGTHAIIGEILPFGAHPFNAVREQLQKGINGPSRGLDGAPVTVVEFSDLQCPHCKDAQPIFDRLAAEDKNARVVFQNFPLPMHDWAMKAAAYADCVGRSSPDGFWKFIQSVYGAQSDITASNADEKLAAFADTAGVKGTDVAACAAKPETTTRVEHSIELGKALDVNSTPTVFINGRKLSAGGLPYDVLQKLVDFAAKDGK
ncbi:MAG TPA: thioredoxin domain-containing protein [Terriglobales bacterium]|jgi:protein-disulfide isomerase|nr:thioredoxin domain-containing protein [Terriglobales bacterium]